MGVNLDGSMWVWSEPRPFGTGEHTHYRVSDPDDTRLPHGYVVKLEHGPDVLDHDEVRACAHDAALDAWGSE